MTAILADLLLPHLIEITVALLAPFLARAIVVVQNAMAKYLGEQATSKVSERFGQAMQRAVMKAVQEDPGATATTAAARAASYIAENNADAVADLGATSAGLRDRALSEMATLGITPKGGR